MFILFNKILFFIIFLSVVSVLSFNDQKSKRDYMCKEIPATLNVQAVLDTIATITKNVSRIINNIEENIQHKYTENERDSFKAAVDIALESKPILPTAQYHTDFITLSNINKKYLINLVLESHDALSFYYNSINDLFKENNDIIYKNLLLFQEIQLYLRSDMICEYRRILNVYSYRWRSINQNKSIKFSHETDHPTPSVRADVHSIIILGLLREWMNRIESVIIVMDKKFV